jgi:hypothetical protein
MLQQYLPDVIQTVDGNQTTSNHSLAEPELNKKHLRKY